MSDLSLYLHIPFCRHRCAYCDFNTYAGQESLMPAYAAALRREIELSARAAEAAGQKQTVHTIFFGGGTPTLLPIENMAAVIRAVQQSFSLSPDLELTLEANPGTVSLAYLQQLRQLGANRLSFGMQSAQSEELRLLEREHDFGDVIRAVHWARQAGFDNFNLDLIFGLPYQTLPAWQNNLEQALSLGPAHLSLYALTLEHNTPMQHWVSRGLLPEPDADLAADMYDFAVQRLAQAGYIQYEISNWALPNLERGTLACRHNLQYWRGLPYLGLGAGAHGYAAGQRTANVLSPAAYIQRLENGSVLPFPQTPATVQLTPLSRQDEMEETMMMGLRLVEEGVSDADFYRRFGNHIRDVFAPALGKLTQAGLLAWTDDRLHLTPEGKLLGNIVFREFVGVEA